MKSKIFLMDTFLNTIYELIINIFLIFIPKPSYSFFSKSKKKKKNKKQEYYYDNSYDYESGYDNNYDDSKFGKKDEDEKENVKSKKSKKDNDELEASTKDNKKENKKKSKSSKKNEYDLDNNTSKSKNSKNNKYSNKKKKSKSKKNKDDNLEINPYLADEYQDFDDDRYYDVEEEDIDNDKRYLDDNKYNDYKNYDDENDFEYPSHEGGSDPNEFDNDYKGNESKYIEDDNLDSYDDHLYNNSQDSESDDGMNDNHDNQNYQDQNETKKKKRGFLFFRKKDKNKNDYIPEDYQDLQSDEYQLENQSNFENDNNLDYQDDRFFQDDNNQNLDYYNNDNQNDRFDSDKTYEQEYDELESSEQESNKRKNKKNKNKKHQEEDEFNYDDYDLPEYDPEYDVYDSKKQKSKKHHDDFESYSDDDCYYDDDYYDTNWEDRYYDGKSAWKDDYYDELNYNQPYKPEKKQKKKKKTLLSIFSSILCFIAMVGAGFSVYFIYQRVTTQSPNNSSENSITRQYQTSEADESVSAIKYISQRTLSLHFEYTIPNDTNHDRIVSGTGWIFNKEQGKEIYYIATNIHVAAFLTYDDKNVYKDGSNEDYGSFVKAEVGFVNGASSSQSAYYNDSNITYLDVNKPSIVYMTTTSNDLNNSLNSSTSSQDSNPSDSTTTIQSTFEESYKNILSSTDYIGIADFAILKYDFTNLLSTSITNNAKAVSFQSWLQYYNNNPTSFYNTPIDLTTTSSAFYNNKYYMGGFPASGEKGSNEWVGLADFPNIVNAEGSPITKSNYLSSASGANLSSNEVYSSDSYIPYYQSGSLKKLLNVGVFGLFAANSISGSSGSMVVINTSSDTTKPNFQVVGIYWGALTLGNKTMGASNLLNVSNYSIGGKQYSGYDLFKEATDAINKTGVSLQYSYNSATSETNSKVSGYYNVTNINSYYNNLQIVSYLNYSDLNKN